MNTPFDTPSVSFGDTQGSLAAAAEVEAEVAAAEVEPEVAAAEVEAEVAAAEVEPEVAAAAVNVGAKIAKRPPTDLEHDVLVVVESYANGTVKLPDGKQLTPHAIAKLVEANRGEDAPVSAGAVSDVLRRWEQIGFITLCEKPVAFAVFVGTSDKTHLNALKEARRERLAAERAAVREAKKAEVSPAPAVEPEVAPEPQAVEPEVEVASEPQAEGTTEPSGF